MSLHRYLERLNGTLTIPILSARMFSGLNVYATASTGATLEHYH